MNKNNPNLGGEANDEFQRRSQKQQQAYNLTSHTPTAEGIRRIEALRSVAKAHADAIIDLTPPGREQSMALSSNERASQESIAAVARHYTLDNPAFAAEQDAPAEDGETKQKSA